MSPRLRVAARLWGFVRHYSNSRGSQARKLSHVTQKFSLAVTGKPNKALILDQLREHVKTLNSPRSNGHAAIILATRDFAAWLDDESFMSNFLKNIFTVLDNESSFSVDVLAGVMDGLAPGRRLAEPSRGFSVLYGSEELLPKLWETQATDLSLNPSSQMDKAASISFDIDAVSPDDYSTEVTLPLANTIFQNGRRSTLFATRWELGPTSDGKPILMNEKQHQRVAITENDATSGESFLPLLPLAPPRKIVSGLGNIVRQVEIEGVVTPASKELEVLIPRLLEERSQRNLYTPLGPIGVWAWVIPPDVADPENNLFSEGHFFHCNKNEKELALSSRSTAAFDKFLGQGRSRLHKILSGGGGWGAKQGLLSLDPETSYFAPEQDDIDEFIRAFQERGNEDQLEGLVKPGSYILFCVEVVQTRDDVLGDTLATPGFVLGVADRNEDDFLSSDGDVDLVEVIPDHFGVMSATGLYRALNSSGRPNTEDPNGTTSISIKTKIDVPKAALWFRSSR